MAGYSEEYKLIMRIEGEERVAALSKQIAAEEANLRNLIVSLKAAGATQQQWTTQTQAQAQAILALNQQLAAAQKQVTEAGGKFQAMSNGLVQLGYAVDDAQYGIKGLANNIQPLLMALGLGGGLAGIIGIVVTATVVLTDKWDKLMSLMGMGKVKTQADEMKELADQATRTVEQEAKLEAYERRKKAGESIAGSLPKAVREQQQAVRTGIEEAGGEARMTAGVTAARGTGVDGLNPAAPGYEDYVFEKSRLRDAEKIAVESLGDASYAPDIRKSAERKMREARDKNIKASQEQAKKLMADAVNGDPSAMQALIGEVRNNPQAFPPGAMAQLKLSTPEGQRDAAWKNMKMAEGEAEMARADTSRERWKASKMVEGERAIQETQERKREIDDYFGAVTPGPDAETRAFMDRQQEVSNRQNGEVVSRRMAQWQRQTGGAGAVEQAMLGMMIGGASLDQATAAAKQHLNGQMGVIPAEKVLNEAKDNASRRMFELQYEQVKEAMGPRQIMGLSAFKDSVMTSGANDPMRQQLEESKKAATLLERIDQTLQQRTFATIVQ